MGEEYYGDSDFVAIIDYSNAKEFPININKIMTGGRQHQIRKLKWHFSNLLNPTDKK